MGKLYQNYANYQKERKRYKSAQKIYLRALVGDKEVGHGLVTSVDEQKELWNDFLIMMKETNEDDTLTLDQLREAVDSEYSSVKAKRERIEAEMKTISSSVEPDAKRARMDDTDNTIPQQQTHKIPAEVVEAVSSSLIETTNNISPALNAEWLARDGTSLPTRPEPPLFTPSPPKLGDPSGKDLLGTELALQLIRILLNKSKDGQSQVCDNAGSTVLDIVNGCWMMTALKEKEAAKSQEALDKKLVSIQFFYFFSICFIRGLCLTQHILVSVCRLLMLKRWRMN